MKIHVQTLEGLKYDVRGVALDQSVDELKVKIQSKTGVPANDQTLIYLGQSLETGTLDKYGLVEGCTINLVHRSEAGVDVAVLLH